jgi:DNA-binding NtrC family response regulator
MEVLKAHDWPGNIRELQNFIERAMVFSPDSASPAERLEASGEAAIGGGAHACRRRSGAYPRNIEANRRADRRAGWRGQSAWIAAYHAGLQDAKAWN